MQPGGYRDVLMIAWPLILSNGSTTIMQLIDRVFLTWFSAEALAASAPAGAMSWTILSFFTGIAGYAATFVAQYTGRRDVARAVSSVWQAILFSAVAAIVMLAFIPLGPPMIRLAGHEPAMAALEYTYYRIFLLGGVFFLLHAALGAWYVGRGETRILLWVSLLGAGINAVLDWLLIFGYAGAPRMGLAGAGWASVISAGVTSAVLFVLFLRDTRHLRPTYWDAALMRRFLRYGFPGGLQVTLDILAWTVFLMFVGGLGVTAVAATGLTFQINTIAFMPMFGFGMAASTLVGQRLGEDKPELAARSAWASLHLGLIYSALTAALFVGAPGVLLAPFGAKADPESFAETARVATILLRFVAVYVVMDTINIVFMSVLKGAGDVVFVMAACTGLGMTIMVAPTLLFCGPNGLGLYGAWTFLTAFICVLALVFLWRFHQGKWREMRVIERRTAETEPVS